MAWTQADIDALKESMKTGVATVSVNGRTVTYRPGPELDALLRQMEAEVNPTTVKARPVMRRGGYREPI